MAFNLGKSLRRAIKPKNLGRVLLGVGTSGTSELVIRGTQAAQDITKGPDFPSIPAAKVPPPPAIAQARPPTRDIPQADAAEADTRALFRRRGRRSALLTPGRGAGARVNPLSQTGRG